MRLRWHDRIRRAGMPDVTRMSPIWYCHKLSYRSYLATSTCCNGSKFTKKDVKLATRTQKISDLAARLSAASQYVSRV